MFIVEGDMPILKGKEYLPESAAQSPLEQLYYCIQQMYLEESREKYQGRYLQLAAQSIRADPKLSSDLETADQLITAGDFYRALKALGKLAGPHAFAQRPSTSHASYIPRVNGWKQGR